MPISSTLIWLVAGSSLFDGAGSTNGFCRLHDGNQRLCGGTGVVDFSQMALQVFLWLVFSIAFVLLSRRLLPPPRRILQDAIVAETLTEIPAGRRAGVLYEGILSGRGVTITTAIAPNQKVYLVRREGTT